MSDPRTTPPANDEVEVSIFGPGKGESIAVHIGGGDWIIVDSCVDQRTRRIPVLDYLTGMGVELSTKVKLVVGTHAHDDHIAGLSRVFAACSSAPFVCSTALTLEEFARDVEVDADIEKLIRKSIRREYREIFDIIEARPSGAGLKHAFETRLLFEREESAGAPAARVTALSPSDKAIDRARSFLARGFDAESRARLGNNDPNELAVALLVTVSDTTVLLGADLLKGPDACGWTAILQAFAFNPLASVFKIPHHGSPGAHHQGVWGQLVGAEAISLLAPYRPSSLPGPGDVTRLKMLSKAVYCSADPRPPIPNKAVKSTRAALAGTATNVRTVGYSGQVRARKISGLGDWDVTTYHPAMQL